MMAGIFIAIEGPEGAGKSSVTAALAQRLQGMGIEPVVVREPGGTPVAEAARKVFLDPTLDTGPVSELFLVLAARADLVANVIRPALDAGRVVISDRYDLSTQAYQVVGRGLDRGAVTEANALATGGLEPHRTVVLDVPAEVGRARQQRAGKQPDRLELAAAEMHERVVRFFAGLSGPHIVHVDATRPVGTVEAEVWDAIGPVVQETIGAGGGLK